MVLFDLVKVQRRLSVSAALASVSLPLVLCLRGAVSFFLSLFFCALLLAFRIVSF